jgi:hypothetical protein
LRARTTIYGIHAYDYLVLGCFILFICNCPCLTNFMNYLIHATPVRPSLCLQYLILLFTIATITTFILLLLLLFCYYHHYKTFATDKPLRASLFPGVAELTTHLLRLRNILWLPLCRINKFGFYFPRRLLRSPILVGHQKALLGDNPMFYFQFFFFYLSLGSYYYCNNHSLSFLFCCCAKRNL